MHFRIANNILTILLLGFCFCTVSGAKQSADQDGKIKSLIDRGDFAEAEEILKSQVSDASQPVTTEPAIQLEVLRRTRYDYALTDKDVLAEIKKEIPDATQADVDRWRKAGDLQYRMIDGEPRYFRRGVSNLLRFNTDAKRRLKKAAAEKERNTNEKKAAAEKKFNTKELVEKLVKLSESSESPEVYPVKHAVHYTMTVHAKNPRVKPGAVVRAWLPFPQEYRQQKGVKLVHSDPPATHVASTSAPQRTVYFEQTIGDDKKPPKFEIDVEFVTSAYCPKLDPEKVQPYDVKSAVYREFTAERAPHIVFTPEVKELANKIVGDETNPLEKARRIF